MKKRAKIITTVASLCLAVALMAFGVYAATTARLGVTSKLSFVAEDVKVRYYWSVVGTETPVNGSNAAYSGSNIGSVANASRDSGSIDLGVEANQGEDLANHDVALGGDNGYNFGRKDNSTITYAITVENYGAYAITVTPTINSSKTYASVANEVEVKFGQSVGDNQAGAESAAATAASTSTTAWTAIQQVAAGKFYTFYVQLKLVNVTHDVAEQELDVTFNAIRYIANP